CFYFNYLQKNKKWKPPFQVESINFLFTKGASLLIIITIFMFFVNTYSPFLFLFLTYSLITNSCEYSDTCSCASCVLSVLFLYTLLFLYNSFLHTLLFYYIFRYVLYSL